MSSTQRPMKLVPLCEELYDYSPLIYPYSISSNLYQPTKLISLPKRSKKICLRRNKELAEILNCVIERDKAPVASRVIAAKGIWPSSSSEPTSFWRCMIPWNRTHSRHFGPFKTGDDSCLQRGPDLSLPLWQDLFPTPRSLNMEFSFQHLIKSYPNDDFPFLCFLFCIPLPTRSQTMLATKPSTRFGCSGCST